MINAAHMQFVSEHKRLNDGLRMGQRFCNLYIKGSWPELFYADDLKAAPLIYDWLCAHQYYDELPQPLKENT
ncbi:hypothetical protein BcepSauron_409 [Burkholderia phage BcepSauron]|uniref:Uncharacterized protein n=1 Tax=Burkholderia phage BcepSauron TaxID=2530033 RepID=A0A482MMA1_9CAUD|nr:hypothetical protein H1O17_gp409 [Burkholderia phage BcepSauron]QBQ74789.1 hypothetical protein BcepSauron_409 [Burkholderia phage BcepSauron]